MKKLWELFYTFAVVGVTTFGGGYAMLPALQREVVEKRRWATEEELIIIPVMTCHSPFSVGSSLCPHLPHKQLMQ